MEVEQLCKSRGMAIKILTKEELTRSDNKIKSEMKNEKTMTPSGLENH